MDHWLLQHQDSTSHDAVTPLTLLMKLLLIFDLHDGEHCKILFSASYILLQIHHLAAN